MDIEMNRYLIFKKGKLKVVCDRNEVYPDDPGMGTPAMVYFEGTYTAGATLWCAMGEGELLSHKRPYAPHKLTDKQVDWLCELEPEISEFLYNGHSAGTTSSC